MSATSAGQTEAAIIAAAALSLVYLFVTLVVPPAATPVRAEMVEAARLMAAAESAIKSCRESRNVPIDPIADPNGTGLIGVERSVITTSTGRLEAKRTTTNPAFAGLLVSLLDEAGVRRGDVVAVGASSSFPALIVATLAAVKALGAEALVISSLGASEWGANVPSFTWMDMEDCLRAKGLFAVRPIARAVGGEEDVGRDMAPEGRALLAARIRGAGGPFLEEPSLERNVGERMALYRQRAGRRPIKAFVNVGGSWANMGTDPDVLKLEPGLSRAVLVPPPARRGVIQPWPQRASRSSICSTSGGSASATACLGTRVPFPSRAKAPFIAPPGGPPGPSSSSRRPISSSSGPFSPLAGADSRRLDRAARRADNRPAKDVFWARLHFS